jgi:DNA transposition AAA+ family ATPase
MSSVSIPPASAPVDAAAEFLITKEYRRFAEFLDAVRRYRYIGLCYGPPGVGKTLSARYYAQWEQLEPRLRDPFWAKAPPAELLARATLVYTPAVANAPTVVDKHLRFLCQSLTWAIDEAIPPDADTPSRGVERYRAELIVVDEADRLKMQSLEQLRDLYDRAGVGLVLIGMPGIEKRLARYPQLYSRVGFVHQYRTLSVEEMRHILAHKWEQLGLALNPDDFTDAEAMTAIARITGGNFRLIQRLFTQVERILQINELRLITKEVVETARENLVIGPL